MKKLFIILIGLVVVILMVGCLNLEGIFPFLNQAPVIISKPIITATEDQLYLYQVEASDPNGGVLTYSFTTKPEGMSIDSESGLITWTPTNNQVGIIHRVVVEVSDGKQSDTQSFKIEVINVNSPPQILSYSPTNINIKINEGSSIKFEVQAHDIDLNTTLSFQWFLNGKLVSNSSVSENDSKNSWIYFTGYGDYSQKRVEVLVSDGELQDCVQWSIKINDITPPTQPTLNTVTSPTNISTQTLSGAKESYTSIWINGVEVISINSDTTWSHPYNLSEGNNSISITSRDAAGNESSAVTAIIILDTGAPAVPTLDAVVSPTNVSPQTISGTKKANTSIWINNIEVIPVNSSTNWIYDFNLSEAENNISVTSRDSAGNESGKATAKIILDTISPATPTLNEIITPTNISIQVLSGSKEDGSSIWINGTEIVSLNSSTEWSYSYNLSEGTNSISITSRDAAGNESSAVLTTIEYDPNIYVDEANVSGIEDGTETYPFDTITEGIEAATPGKSVLVAAGTYKEQLIINKGITLQGVGVEEEVTLISGLECTGGYLITVTADDVNISGFTIDGGLKTDVGIYSDSSSSIEISKNIIKSHKDSGILYHGTSNDYPSGIYVYDNDIFQNSLNGIKVTGAGSGIIEVNRIRNNNYGIKASNDAFLEVKKNNIHHNYDSGIFCRHNSSLLIWDNEITFNSYDGIRVGEQYNDTTNPDIGGGNRGGIGRNNITGNTSHGVSNMTDHNISAKYNWWGDVAGPKYPGNPNGNAGLSSDWVYWSETGGNIEFDPYLKEPQTF